MESLAVCYLDADKTVRPASVLDGAARQLNDRPSGVMRCAANHLESSEEALLEGLQCGDPRAVVAFFSRYERDVRSVLTRIMGSSPDVSDALQDTFIRALKSALQLREALALRVWLRRVATSVAFDHLRQRQRLRWCYEADATGGEDRTEVVSPEDHAAFCDVHRVLEMMPSRERSAFFLRYVDELELKEIAVACAVSIATVKRRLTRANTRFRSLAQHQPGLAEWMSQKSA